MIEKLISLDYKKIEDFDSEKFRNHFKKIIANRPKLDNCNYYVKIVDQEVKYVLHNDSSFTNRISLSILFYYDEKKEKIIDCFCTPSFRFEIKTEIDFEIFENLFNIYKNDVKEVMANEKENIIYSA